jgi:hypothetical protein
METGLRKRTKEKTMKSLDTQHRGFEKQDNSLVSNETGRDLVNSMIDNFKETGQIHQALRGSGNELPGAFGSKEDFQIVDSSKAILKSDRTGTQSSSEKQGLNGGQVFVDAVRSRPEAMKAKVESTVKSQGDIFSSMRKVHESGAPSLKEAPSSRIPEGAHPEQSDKEGFRSSTVSGNARKDLEEAKSSGKPQDAVGEGRVVGTDGTTRERGLTPAEIDARTRGDI